MPSFKAIFHTQPVLKKKLTCHFVHQKITQMSIKRFFQDLHDEYKGEQKKPKSNFLNLSQGPTRFW